MKTMFMVALVRDGEISELQEVHFHNGKHHNENMLDIYGRSRLVSCVATTDRPTYYKELVRARTAVYKELVQRYDEQIERLKKEDAPVRVISDTKEMQDSYLELYFKMIGRTVNRYRASCARYERDIVDFDEIAVQAHQYFLSVLE